MSGCWAAERSHHLVDGAGEALSRARALLMQPAPQNLDIACSALSTAIACINDLQTLIAVSPSGNLNPALARLRQEVDFISRLLEHAASYHVNLMQSMIEASGAAIPPGVPTDSAQHLFLDA